MNVVALLPHTCQEGQQVESVLIETVSPGNLELIYDVGAFLKRVARLVSFNTIVVAHVLSEDDLHLMAAHRGILQSFRIILILPGAGQDLVTVGHALAPRLLLSAMDAVRHLPSVLTKMRGETDS